MAKEQRTPDVLQVNGSSGVTGPPPRAVDAARFRLNEATLKV